jgi:hypothetical protein
MNFENRSEIKKVIDKCTESRLFVDAVKTSRVITRCDIQLSAILWHARDGEPDDDILAGS